MTSEILYPPATGRWYSGVRAHDIETALLDKLRELKYTDRPDIHDRATLEANFRQKFETLNRVRLADQLRGAMNADDFRDYMLAFLFLRYLSDNYEAAAKKELGPDYPAVSAGDGGVPLSLWYANNPGDVADFERQMRRKVHYVIKPDHL